MSQAHSDAGSSAHLFVQGVIHTLDPTAPRAEWLVVRNGKVQQVGRGPLPRELSALPQTNLKGAVVLPGLIDSHVHLGDLGKQLTEIDLRDARSAEEAAALIGAALKQQPGQSTLIGTGWDQTHWPGQQFPNRQVLDRIAPDRPVVLYRIDLHAAWVNTAALRATKILDQKTDPVGGKILRDALGQPTGVLIDDAMNPLQAIASRDSAEQWREHYRRAFAHAAKFGITAAHEAGVTWPQYQGLREAVLDTPHPPRLYVMALADDAHMLQWAIDHAHTAKHATPDQLPIRAIKVILDGAMGSRGAALLEPYADDPSNSGLLRYDQAALNALVQRTNDAGLQIAIHAIGDRAMDSVLTALETNSLSTAQRPRIEHAQMIRLGDVARMSKRGAIAAMQPIHCTSDMHWVPDRIGERARGAYAWKTFLTANVPLAFGSDAPVESIDPWQGIYAAMTRQDGNGNPSDGFYPAERLSFSEALAAYTAGAAFASFTEGTVGVLRPGAWADFIVINVNPFTASPNVIRDIKVQETYIGGHSVWTRDTSTPIVR